MKHKYIFRHGDVVLYQVKTMPKKGKVKKVNSFVLARGEQTGHKHLLTAQPQTLIEIVEDSTGKRYIRINKSAKLTHEEHGPIMILPGIYEQRQEKEFDWFQTMTTRKVID